MEELNNLEPNQISELENNYGIQIEKFNTPADLAEMGYRKFPGDKLMLQNVPVDQVIAAATGNMVNETMKSAYQLVIDPQKLHGNSFFLGKSKLGPGVFSANVYEKGRQGTATQIGFKDIDATATKIGEVAYSVFAVASFIVGEYFMYNIDKKLAAIESTGEQILTFLELDKRCKLSAQQLYLMEIHDNLSAIISNDIQCQATIVSVQSIRQKALGDILFYREYAKSALLKEDNDVKKKVENVAPNIPAYWYSLHIYSLATVIEVMLTGNTDEHYLHSLVQDLNDKYDNYKKFFDDCQSSINAYIERKEPDKLPFFQLKVGNIFPGNGKLEVGNDPAEKQKQDKNAYLKIVQDYEDAGGIKIVADDIEQYSKMNNEPISIACVSGNVYIKAKN